MTTFLLLALLSADLLAELPARAEQPRTHLATPPAQTQPVEAVPSPLIQLRQPAAAASTSPSAESPLLSPPGSILTAPASKAVSSAHIIYYNPDEVPTIYTKIRFATAIIFPEPEKILEVVCGDKDWWQIAGQDRIIYIKPSRAGIETNLTAIGASGNVYQFYLSEITPTPGGPAPPATTPFVKVSMRLGETFTQHVAAGTGLKYVAKAEMDSVVDAADQRIRAANEETNNLKTAAAQVLSQEITRLRTNYPAALQFNYQIALDTKPFFVRAMFADDKFTYIKLDSKEAPAVYEIKDGQPTLVNFDFLNGIFVIRKVVDQGHLVIGKAKLPFSRKGK